MIDQIHNGFRERESDFQSPRYSEISEGFQKILE
jgi:hypothetical protein